MSKKNKHSRADVDELKLEHEAATAAHAEAEAAFVEARDILRQAEESRSPGREVRGEVRAPYLEARARAERAKHALSVAAVRYGEALSSAEVAEGDDIATACDPAHVLADVEAAIAEAEDLEARAKALRVQAAQRLKHGREAHAQLSERRRAAGLPAPPPLPNEAKALAVRVRDGFVPAEVSKNVLLWAREAGDIREALERAAREREEQKARAADYDRAWRDRDLSEKKATRKMNAERQAERDAERREREALVEANRRRERGESAPTTGDAP